MKIAPTSKGRHRRVATRPRVQASRRGMALIDVIIGALLLGLGLAVILSLSSRSLASQSEGERTMVASWLADELLTMVLVEGPEEYHHLYDMEGWFYEPFDQYFYSVEIKDNGEGLAHTVTVNVGWEQGRGRREIQMQAAIAVRGGDPDEPREPLERIDREARDYKRIFGDEDADIEGEDTRPALPPITGGSGVVEEEAPEDEEPSEGDGRGR